MAPISKSDIEWMLGIEIDKLDQSIIDKLVNADEPMEVHHIGYELKLRKEEQCNSPAIYHI